MVGGGKVLKCEIKISLARKKVRVRENIHILKVSPINRIGGRKKALIERADFILKEKQTGLSLNYKV